MAPSLESIAQRIQSAIYGMYIGDALSMPVHWYYDRSRIFKDFGPKGITGYAAPVKHFPGSIMNLSNTGGGGRGSDKDSIIGDVLVKGKKEYWLRGSSYHYHHGMKPGENTLDTIVAGLMMKTIVDLNNDNRNLMDTMYSKFAISGSTSNGRADKNEFTNSFLDRYINFMTTKDSHNDVYVATAHRMFFANLVNRNTDKFLCADNDGHNTDSIDGLINVGVVSLNQMVMDAALHGLGPDSSEAIRRSPGAMKALVSDSINVIRESSTLPVYGNLYHELLVKLIIDETPLRQAIVELVEGGNGNGKGLLQLDKRTLDAFANTDPEGNQDPMSACYVKSNFPVTLLMAYKYHDSIEKALLASANAGGENVNRSAILGTIMGAALGQSETGKNEIKKWSGGLVARDGITKDISKFLEPLGSKIQFKSEL